MKIRLILMVMLFCAAGKIFAQEDLNKIYSPTANAEADIKAAIEQAAKENKHVLLQIGGNWCPWCIKLNKYWHQDAQLDSVLKANYVLYHLNYSKENKNLPILEKLGNPQRFGFPVLVFLDAKGNRLNTQDTGMLEACKGSDPYDKEKVFGVLKNWTPSALLPKAAK